MIQPQDGIIFYVLLSDLTSRHFKLENRATQFLKWNLFIASCLAQGKGSQSVDGCIHINTRSFERTLRVGSKELCYVGACLLFMGHTEKQNDLKYQNGFVSWKLFGWFRIHLFQKSLFTKRAERKPPKNCYLMKDKSCFISKKDERIWQNRQLVGKTLLKLK